jgi:hypothetical protein
MKMFAVLDRAKPDAGNVRGLNLAAVKNTTTVQVARLPYLSSREMGHFLAR